MAMAWQILRALEEGRRVSYLIRDGVTRAAVLERRIEGACIRVDQFGLIHLQSVIDHPGRFVVEEVNDA